MRCECGFIVIGDFTIIKVHLLILFRPVYVLLCINTVHVIIIIIIVHLFSLVYSCILYFNCYYLNID